MKNYKRSNEPLVWSLFGAGGVVAAYILPALILCVGILFPLGIVTPEDLSYARVVEFIRHWFGGLVVWAVISLSAWHALHRIFHGLHDLKVGAHTLRFVLCYGAAAVITLYCGYRILML